MRRLIPIAWILAISFGWSAPLLAGTDRPPAAAPLGWAISFDEEFNSFNTSRWDTIYPWGSRSMKKELELYVDPSYAPEGHAPLGLNPFSVQGGVLTLRADRPSASLLPLLGGKQFTSGLLTSYHAFSQLYGYFEMNARMPAGQGLWPAFWLLPTDISWPPEIDVMEALMQDPTKFYATIHTASPSYPRGSASFPVSVPDLTKAFHRFGVLWSSKWVAWYFDGTLVASTATPADMHKAMYLLVDLAVGGAWPGSPSAATKFPADLQIDYIRAYKLPANYSGGAEPAPRIYATATDHGRKLAWQAWTGE